MSTFHRVIEGDCLKVLPTITEKIDAVVTDPPYGIGENYRSHDDTRANLESIIGPAVEQMRRIASVVLITPGNGNQHLYPPPDWTLAWYEPAGAGMNRWGFTCWQPILAYGKCPHLKHKMGLRPDVYVGNGELASSGLHPCAKPMGVMRWMLERADPTEFGTILDPFGGSGTTAVAAKMTGRNSITIEIDPGYCEIARRRIADAASLFHQAPTLPPRSSK